jgi:hypothetical protein
LLTTAAAATNYVLGFSRSWQRLHGSWRVFVAAALVTCLLRGCWLVYYWLILTAAAAATHCLLCFSRS